MKILFKKTVLTKKPFGPQRSTMRAAIVELGEIPLPNKKSEYVIQTVERQFNIQQALRSPTRGVKSPEQVKKPNEKKPEEKKKDKMTPQQMEHRVVNFVKHSLRLQDSLRTVKARTPSLEHAKKLFQNVCKKLRQ